MKLTVENAGKVQAGHYVRLYHGKRHTVEGIVVKCVPGKGLYIKTSTGRHLVYGPTVFRLNLNINRIKNREST